MKGKSAIRAREPQGEHSMMKQMEVGRDTSAGPGLVVTPTILPGSPKRHDSLAPGSWTCGLKGSKRINAYDLKTPSLWAFVMATQIQPTFYVGTAFWCLSKCLAQPLFHEERRSREAVQRGAWGLPQSGIPGLLRCSIRSGVPPLAQLAL